MRSGIRTYMLIFLPSFILLLFAPHAGPGMLHGSVGDGGGAHVDLVVRKITVTPVRAHVGDVVRIEMEWEYWGDITNNYYETTAAEVQANGKVVASKPFTYDFGASLGDTYREIFLWDTTGMPSGNYRIRGEVPLRLDATPYDNFLVVKESLTLFPAGAIIPEEKENGGVAIAENRRWLER